MAAAQRGREVSGGGAAVGTVFQLTGTQSCPSRRPRRCLGALRLRLRGTGGRQKTQQSAGGGGGLSVALARSGFAFAGPIWMVASVMPRGASASPLRGRSWRWPRRCLGALRLCLRGTGRQQKTQQSAGGEVDLREGDQRRHSHLPSLRSGRNTLGTGGVTYLSSFFRLEMADAGRGVGVFRGGREVFPPRGGIFKPSCQCLSIGVGVKFGRLRFPKL